MPIDPAATHYIVGKLCIEQCSTPLTTQSMCVKFYLLLKELKVSVVYINQCFRLETFLIKEKLGMKWIKSK